MNRCSPAMRTLDRAARLDAARRSPAPATPASLRASISVARQVAEAQQQIVNGIGRPRVKALRQMLQLLLERVEHRFVEQIAQLGVADQIAQLRLIDRERLRAPFGQRRVAVVDVVGDVAEQQRRRERRRLLRFDVDDAQRAAADAAQDVGQRRQIEDVAQALAIGLENDRERSESRRHREQIRGALAQLPQRRARARAAGGAAAARGRPLRGTAPRTSPSIPSCRTTSRSTSSGSGSSSEVSGGRSPSGYRTTNPSSDHITSTSMPASSRMRAVAAIAHGAWTRLPSGDSTATRQSPRSSRDRSMTMVRSSGTAPAAACCSSRYCEQVGGRQRIEAVIAAASAATAAARFLLAQLAHQLADRHAELDRAARAFALPERHLARLAGRRRDQHAIVRDLIDAPGRGAEQKRFAGARLEHHLFVELADARLVLVGAGQEHAEQPAIRNRAGVGDGDALGALPRHHDAVDAIPRDARPQLGEFVRRIAARQHVEHAVEDRPAQLGERRRRSHRAIEIVDRPSLHRRHRDELLREHVERIARVA